MAAGFTGLGSSRKRPKESFCLQQRPLHAALKVLAPEEQEIASSSENVFEEFQLSFFSLGFAAKELGLKGGRRYAPHRRREVP